MSTSTESDAEKTTKQVNVAVTESTHRLWKIEAARQGITMQRLIHGALSTILYVKENLSAGGTVELARWEMVMKCLGVANRVLEGAGFDPAELSQFQVFMQKVEVFAKQHMSLKDGVEETKESKEEEGGKTD